MTVTLYLRFPDEATFRAALPIGFEQQGETGAPLPAGVEALSIIGAFYTPGTVDAQGNPLTPAVLVPGFHVNALGVLPGAWHQFQITPGSPSRVFG